MTGREGNRWKARRAVFSGLFPLAAVVIVVGLLTVMYGIGRRKSFIRDTQANLLFNATLTAQGFDSNLRIAELILESLAVDFADGPFGPTDEARASFALLDHARRIGAVDNVYLLDGEWRVILTAFFRIDPSLVASPELLARMGRSGITEALIAECPAEGGPILALIRPFARAGRPYYLAALFTGFDVAGRLAPLRSGSRGRVVLQDRTGNVFNVGGSPIIKGGAAFEVATSFPNYPVKVIVSASSDEVLSRWWPEVRFLAIAVAVFCAAILALGFYRYVLFRRRHQVAALQEALAVDATLFREINHRIKNNLVVVESVLSLGAGQFEEGTRSAMQVFESAKDRVHSIALVHELLYKGKGATQNVVLAEYVSALRGALGDAYDPESRIERVTDIDLKIELPFDLAIPCGMILSELITNAYKYAFPDGRRGMIAVRIFRSTDGDIEILVEDDGVGFLPDAAETMGGIGMLLVSSLASQISGEITRESMLEGGVRWKLRFRSPEKTSPSLR